MRLKRGENAVFDSWTRDVNFTRVGRPADFQLVGTSRNVFIVVFDGQRVSTTLLWFDEQRKGSVAMIEQSTKRRFRHSLTVRRQFSRTGVTRVDETFDFFA